MRTLSLRALAAAGALALALVGANPTATADAPAHAAEAEAMLALVNDVRATPTDCGAEGELPAAEPLALDERLSEAARLHAQEMRELGAIDHVGADGGTVDDRIERQGYAWSAAGENVAFGYETPEAVVDGWLASDTHCLNLMRPVFTDMGVGRDGTYWALVLAAPR
jgi:uncharacterized protein YkwD